MLDRIVTWLAEAAGPVLDVLARMTPPPGGLSARDAEAISLVLMVAAVGVDALVGAWIPRPRQPLARLVDLVERKLNRESRSERTRLWRGALLLAVAMLAAGGIGTAVLLAGRHLPWGWTAPFLLLLLVLSQRQPIARLGRVRRALDARDNGGAAAALEGFSRRLPDVADPHAIARAALETAAQRIPVSVVGPLFWYALLGPVGLAIYAAVDVLGHRLGFLSHRFASFGLAPRRMDVSLKFFPARIGGLLVAGACAFVPGASARGALRTMLAHAKHHRSQAAGWPIGALAGGLKLALAGPRRYPQEIVQERWIGDGRARLLPADLKRGALVLAVACCLNALLLCLIVLARLSLS